MGRRIVIKKKNFLKNALTIKVSDCKLKLILQLVDANNDVEGGEPS